MLTDEQVAAVRRRASAWVMSPDLDPEWATAWDTAPAIDRAVLLAHIDAQAERIAALEAEIRALIAAYTSAADAYHQLAGHPYDREEAARGQAKFEAFSDVVKDLQKALCGYRRLSDPAWAGVSRDRCP